MSKRISRASFLRGLIFGTAGVAAAGGGTKLYLDSLASAADNVPCRLLGPSMSAGHMIRNRVFANVAQPKVSSQSRIVIVGGGIAGLSAAWWLKKHGVNDFVLLELEKQVGGNSTSGRNKISAYPWAAHYVPIANPESEYVRTLFAELGIIEGFDAHNEPLYNELHLCHDPQERLLKCGAFNEGLVPRKGLQAEDRAQIDRFFKLIAQLRKEKGGDGKPVFAIPLDLSSADEKFRALDKISMSEWMQKEGFTSRPLVWYVNYCCKDDYGSLANNVSAWAGLHYFAGRRGTAANADMNALVTWPEGNGYLVNALRERLKDHLQQESPVHKIKSTDDGLVLSYVNGAQEQKAIAAEYVVFAAPRFISKYVIADQSTTLGANDLSDLAYAPWLVANISLTNVPEGNGLDTAWDNVSYASDSLGYVVATHQNITTRRGATVITYYQPLSDMDPVTARKELLAAQPDKWRARILADLERMHPGISRDVTAIELWPWGHGMIRPSVGYIWGETRQRMKQRQGNIFFAHSDMSGISNFEEAQYQGVTAAQGILHTLGRAET